MAKSLNKPASNLDDDQSKNIGEFCTGGQVWKAGRKRRKINIMEKKTLSCYHYTYLKADVLLLAIVFETFQNMCLKQYKLDLAHFYTAHGLVC